MAASNYRAKQEAQLAKFLAWQKAEGGVELPVTLHTMLKPEQQARVAWLVKRARGHGPVLECGASWGYVLASIAASTAAKDGVSVYAQGHKGIDLAPWNVEMARLLCPDLRFEVGDVREIAFPDKHFSTVVLAEVLEHLAWPDEVERAIGEAVRVARERVLITVPNGALDTEEAHSMKHPYLIDHEVREEITSMLARHVRPYARLYSEEVGPFICWELEVR